MNKKLFFLSLVICLANTSLLFSQKPAWVIKNPFDKKEFVENVGQFTNVQKQFPDHKIYFETQSQNIHYYFTDKGIVLRKDVLVKRSKNEIRQMLRLIEQQGSEEDNEEEEKEERKKLEYKIKTNYEYILWQGINSNVELIKGEQVSKYYTYGNVDGKHPDGLKAYAYKTITYKNIYPFIDLIFEIPKDSSGLKYKYILHPGANTNNIKNIYSPTFKLSLTQNNELAITSVNKEFPYLLDHAPITINPKTKQVIPSSFVLSPNNIIGFKINTNESIVTNELILDPWIINPTFSNGSQLHDVDYDNSGNAYAYGGGGGAEYHLLKISSAGSIIWDYSFFSANYHVGDFCVNRSTGECYIGDGWNFGTSAKMEKISAAGTLVTTNNGNTKMKEIWRLEYSPTLNKIVMAGSSTTNPSYRLAYADPNLSSITYNQFFSTNNKYHDPSNLTLSNCGDGFLIISQNLQINLSQYNNTLHKFTLGGTTPAYGVSTGHQFQETYIGPYQYTNGYNGLVASDKRLYSYDSHVLQRWDAASGTLLNTINITPSATVQPWGGITADDCEHIFVANNNQIVQYDNTLSAVGTIATMSDFLTDLKLDQNNQILYACGNGFVTAINVTLPPCLLTATVTATNPGCGSSSAFGTATVTASGGIAPYTYSWTTSPVQTTTVATNLSQGIYTVTVTDDACTPHVATQTVSIQPSVSYTVSEQVVQPTCANQNGGSVSLIVNGGTAPITYTWSTGASTYSVNNLPSGIYTYTVADASGCSKTQTVSLQSPQSFTVTEQVTNTTCASVSNGSVTLTVNGGTTPITYNWSNGGTNSSINNILASVYSYTVTDGNGCLKTQTVNVTSGQFAVTTTVQAQGGCTGSNNSSIASSVTGGNGSYSYTWSPSGGNIATATGLSAGTYTLLVVDGVGCIDTSIATIPNIPGSITANFNHDNVCVNSIASFTNTSNPSTGITSTWYFGDGTTSSSQSTTHTYINANTYTVSLSIVTTAGNCKDSISKVITIYPKPIINFTSSTSCLGSTTTFSSTSSIGSGNTITNWYWDINNDGTTDNTTPNHTHTYATAGTHSVELKAISNNNCSDSIVKTVYVNDNPIPLFSADKESGCPELCVTFSDNSSVTLPAKITNWTWDFGDGTTSNETNAISKTHCYTNTSSSQLNKYTITLTVKTDSACSATITKNNYITVFPTPIASYNINPTTATVVEPIINFTNTSIDYTKWYWYYGDSPNLDSINKHPTHIYSSDNSKTYNTFLVVQNQYGCRDTASKLVEIGAGFSFYIPNTFTPNGDKTNEFFTGVGIGIVEYEMWIFDRWGLMIYYTDDINKPWDGRAFGKPEIVQQDTYVWKVRLKDIFNKPHNYVGHVNVVK